MVERLDEERLETLRTWGAGLSTNARDELRAAGKAILMLVDEIDRLEADSKFFRSLVVVALVGAAHFLLRAHSPTMSVVAVVLALLSYHRYRQQRWKMTELSYATAVIVHAALGPAGARM